MKPENTLENKEKFFALYFKQDVLRINQYQSVKIQINSETIFNRVYNNDCYLELKPLESISDEDAFEIAKKAYFNSDKSDDIIVKKQVNLLGMKSTRVKFYNYGVFCAFVDIYYNKCEINLQLKGTVTSDFNFQPVNNSHFIFDYLRSKSYALPWMGLTVEELIDYGWIKLKE